MIPLHPMKIVLPAALVPQDFALTFFLSILPGTVTFQNKRQKRKISLTVTQKRSLQEQGHSFSHSLEENGPSHLMAFFPFQKWQKNNNCTFNNGSRSRQLYFSDLKYGQSTESQFCMGFVKKEEKKRTSVHEKSEIAG